MKTTRFLVLALLVLCAWAGSAAIPVISSITPGEGSEFGGTEVVIRGSGFTVCESCPAHAVLPTVYFGTERAPTVGYIDSTELRVRTPAHPPVAVAVTVEQREGQEIRRTTVPNGFTFLEERFRMTPTSGPSSGGTVVTITGPFGSWPYDVVFGEQFARGYRVDANTLVAIAPPGSGTVDVRIFEYDVFIDTNIRFTYVTGPEDVQERVLLPLLTPPVNGANGSRFETELRAVNRTDRPAQIFGLTGDCVITCPTPDFETQPLVVEARGEVGSGEVVLDGTPGRFIYLPNDEPGRLWLNLRAFDTTATSGNFGTELPVVRDRDFFRNAPIVFVFGNVPTDPNFRSTVRIYATAGTTVTMEVETATSKTTRLIPMPPGGNRFIPAYAQVGNLPAGAGPIRITLRTPEPGRPGFATPFWAFVSVTNNRTQMITTIRP